MRGVWALRREGLRRNRADSLTPYVGRSCLTASHLPSVGASLVSPSVSVTLTLHLIPSVLRSCVVRPTGPRSPSSSVCRLPRCSTRPSAWSPPPACLATRLASLPPTPCHGRLVSSSPVPRAFRLRREPARCLLTTLRRFSLRSSLLRSASEPPAGRSERDTVRSAGRSFPCPSTRPTRGRSVASVGLVSRPAFGHFTLFTALRDATLRNRATRVTRRSLSLFAPFLATLVLRPSGPRSLVTKGV